MSRSRLAPRLLVVWVLGVLSTLGACSSVNPTVVAVLAADVSSTLQQPLDVEGLRERIEQTCRACGVEVYDAAGDAQAQEEQLDRALAASADIVILDPVEPERTETLVGSAEVPVLAYGTLVSGADWFVGTTTPATPAPGVDSDLEAAREVISGERDSFTHLPAAAMSEQAADVAVGVLADEPVGDSIQHDGVTSWTFEAVEVTVNDLTSVVVASGAMTLEDLCADETRDRCRRLGLV